MANRSGKQGESGKVTLLEDHYKVLLNHSSDLIFLRDKDGILLYVTPSVKRMLGYAPNDLIGKPTWDLIHPDDKPKIDDWRKTVLEKKENFHSQAQMKTRKGNYVWLDTLSTVIYDKKGEFKYIISTSRDITDQKLAEAKNKRYKLFTEMTNDIIMQRDCEGLILYVSPAVEKQLGYAPKELVGKTFWKYLDEKGVNTIDHWKQEVFTKGKTIRIQFKAKTNKGKFIWLESETQPVIEKGEVVSALSSIRNIETEKQAEFEIAKLAAIVEGAVNEIYVTDPKNLKFLYANDQARKNLGYSQKEFSNMTPEDIGGHLNKKEFRKVYGEMLRQGGVSKRVEGIARRKDGSTYDVSLVGQLINLGDKPVFVTFMEDITERKQAQELLFQAQKMDVVGQLTGGIAHNFNNLLTTILASLRLLEQQEKSPEKREMMEMAIKSTKRGAELTHRLLAFARKQHLAPTVVSIEEILGEVQSLLVFAMGGNIEVKAEKVKEDLFIKVDPGEFESALLNLALNARDAMPKGGTINISAKSKTLNKAEALALELKPGPYVVTQITDSGEGMSAAVLEKAFEPFFTTKDVGEGSGLGLSMVFGFAKQSGGAMDIESEPGKGTRVRIYLPKER